MTSATPLRGRQATALVGAVLALTGCAFSAPDTSDLGVRRVGLDLAYTDDTLKVQVPPNIIVTFVPAAPDLIRAQVPGAEPFLPVDSPIVGSPQAPPPSVPVCPPAPEGAVPETPAAVAITAPPIAGTYLQRNDGTIKVLGAVPLTFPYPTTSRFVIRDVTTVDTPDPVSGVKVRRTTFVVEDQILPTFTIVSTYEYDTKQVNLVRRLITSGPTTTGFEPTPAVQVVAFGGQGTTWNAAGIDTDALNSLIVQGAIAAPEAVDVCGVLIDAQRVSTEENQADIANGSQSGTRTGMPNITHYAMQFGGLPVRREQHTTQVIRTEAGPVTIETDVVSTLMSVQPEPQVTPP